MATRLRPRRLSTGTLFYKKVFPALWAGGAVVVLGVMVWRVIVGAPAPFDAWPYLAVAVVGFVITRLIASQLVDEVIDAGDHLLVRLKSEEERVALADIEAVKESLYLRQPHRIELLLERPGKFGRVISFIPSGFLPVPFFRTELFHELQRRVAVARRSR